MGSDLHYDVVIAFDHGVADGHMKHYVAVPGSYEAAVGDRLVGELNGTSFSRVVVEQGDGDRRLLFGEGWLRDAGLDVGDRAQLVLRPEPDPDHVEIPDELSAALRDDAIADHAWSLLTPGRQRTLAYTVARPKRTETRQRKATELVAELRDGRV